jgi:uncharacterized protein YdaU (DUF1376 family)
MAEHPFMSVRVAALLADTTWMSAEGFGVYGRLLFTMWANGGRVGGVSLKRWRKIWPHISHLFISAGGQLSQKRLLP